MFFLSKIQNHNPENQNLAHPSPSYGTYNGKYLKFEFPHNYGENFVGLSYKLKLIISGTDLKMTMAEDPPDDHASLEPPEKLHFEMTLAPAEVEHFKNLNAYLIKNKDNGNVNLLTLGGRHQPVQEFSESDGRSDSGVSVKSSKAKNLVNLPKSLGSYEFAGQTNDENVDFELNGCVASMALNKYEFDLHGHEFYGGCKCYSCFLW